MSKVLYILVALFMTIAVISAGENAFSTSSSAVSFTSDIGPSLDHQDIIYRHIASVIMKRSSSSKGIPNTPQLYTEIVAQIKARIHTEITSKISASLFQKVKANLSIKASVMGGVVQVNNAEIEAIQSAAVDGLKSKITNTIEKNFDKVISKSVGPKISQYLPSSQKVFTTTQLSKALMHAETIVRSELKTVLPEIQKTLKSSVNTQLKAHIKDLEIDIPGVLKIEVSAKIDIVSSVKTVVTSIYKSYADVSVAVTVKSYVSKIQKALKK